jgi:sugar lactone lactonase YvrE
MVVPIGWLAVVLLIGCSTRESADSPATQSDSPAVARLVTTTSGFSAPEAVRYDPGQDIYFVSNWNSGDNSALDNNGFISRLRPDGAIDSLRFIRGGAGGATLHAPRGMTIIGDTLWVTDVDAVRGFDRRTGAQLATITMAGFRPGFLNDIAVGPDGALYVTDTGTDRIFRVANGVAAVAISDTTLGRPNGITWDRANARFIVVPYGGDSVIRSWRPPSSTLETIGRSAGAQFDGVEVLADGRILVASQGDTSLHIFAGDAGRPVIRTSPDPADIAVDTRRNRVAVPFVRLNRVEIWEIPGA